MFIKWVQCFSTFTYRALVLRNGLRVLIISETPELHHERGDEIMEFEDDDDGTGRIVKYLFQLNQNDIRLNIKESIKMQDIAKQKKNEMK